MLDSDIRGAATILVIAQLFSGLALLARLSQGCAFAVGSLSAASLALSVTWLGLVWFKMARLRRDTDTEKGLAEADRSVLEDIREVWLIPIS